MNILSMFHLILHINFSRNARELVKRIEISILGMNSLFNWFISVCNDTLYPCLATFLANIRRGHGQEITFSLVLSQTCVNIRRGVGGENNDLLWSMKSCKMLQHLHLHFTNYLWEYNLHHWNNKYFTTNCTNKNLE